MLSVAQVALIGAISAPFALAFSPVFTSPRQCESLRITWSELDLPVVDMPLTEIFMSLIPLDNDPSRIVPQPYSLSVPSGGHEIAALPFPAGTQFFASAQILGSSGFTRRTVSNVFTVEHSANSGCLPAKVVPTGAKAKSFGKRQISVVGPSLVTSTGVPAPVNAIANPSGATTSSSAPAASSSSGTTPPIRVIGSSNIPASGAPNVPANAAPAPSSSGPVPPIRVIGTSVISATDESAPPASSSDASDAGANEPSATSTDSSYAGTETTTSTSCTETPTELPVEAATSTDVPPSTITMPSNENDGYYQGSTMPSNENDGYYQDENNTDEEEPCEETMDPSEHQSMHETATPSETRTTVAALPSATNTEVVHYTAFDDMVNAANSMFKAWNPYKAAYTPLAGN